MCNKIKDFVYGILWVLFMLTILWGIGRFCGWVVNDDNNTIENGYHTLVYTVYYPGNTKTYTKYKVYDYKTYSNRGSNAITVIVDKESNHKFARFLFGERKTEHYNVYEGTAPVEIVSFNKE